MKRVNFSWSQLLILGGSTVASWLAGTTKLPPVQTGNDAPSSVSVPREIPAPVRLQDWRSPAVVVARPERNVFTFKEKEPVRAAARPPEQPQPVAPAQPAATPALRLIGMAQDDGHDAPAATAIVAGHGQVYLVRPGDVIPPAYTVVRVDAESVALADGTTGATFRLFMK